MNSDIDTYFQPMISSATNKNTYIFLDGITANKSATSCIFYLNMMDNIRKCLNKNNIKYVMIKDIDEMNIYDNNAVLIIDIFIVSHLYLSNPSQIEKLFGRKYIIIIGENYNHKTNTFIGWHECGIQLSFDKDNIFYKIIENSYIITYQNERTRKQLSQIKTDNLLFFPIDGYMDEYVIEHPIATKDIDVLFYGHYDAFRRRPILDEISKLPINFVMTSDIFNLNILKFFIDRSKIIFHMNSMDDCYHVPYSKIGKLLSNNKIVITEYAEEFIDSDLYDYVYIFDIDQYIFKNQVKTPLYIDLIESVLRNYDEVQKSLNNKNPSALMKKNYNFENNVLLLINYDSEKNNFKIYNY